MFWGKVSKGATITTYITNNKKQSFFFLPGVDHCPMRNSIYRLNIYNIGEGKGGNF